MYPLLLSHDAVASVEQYIDATYAFGGPKNPVYQAFWRRVSPRDRHERIYSEREQGGLFKGPYLQLRAPFVQATERDQADPTVAPIVALAGVRPYQHQITAFQRLSTANGHQPQPTILTTGTGSGKTEAFLFPLLEHIARQNTPERQPGVKAIIMYPMNALASDQAARIAHYVANKTQLAGRVTAGLYIGLGSNRNVQRATQMAPDHIIEDNDTIQTTPPDILLTNFKMLDYALLHRKRRGLWQGNVGGGHALQYLVVDELHTYDGAQGTDVANLVRRLKLKLGLAHLTPVGTSATLGNGPDVAERLARYASDVFGETVGTDAIVTETRREPADYAPGLEYNLPNASTLQGLSLSNYKSPDTYLSACREVWQMPQEGDMSAALLNVELTRWLLTLAADPIYEDDLLLALGDKYDKFGALLRGPGVPSEAPVGEYRGVLAARNCVESLVALLASARDGDKRPVVHINVHVWQRELSGLLRVVSERPEFVWKGAPEARPALPVFYCRDCDLNGWVGLKRRGDTFFHSDVRETARAMAQRDPDVFLLTPKSDDFERWDERADTRQQTPIEEKDCRIDVQNLCEVTEAEARAPGAVETLELRSWQSIRKVPGKANKRLDPRCPHCGSPSIHILGSRMSSLSSVVVGRVLASDLDQKDQLQRKLLIFNNSVQDAAYLAGLYELRTYHLLIRNGIYRCLKDGEPKLYGDLISLADLQRRFREYWKGKLGDDYYYRFLPDQYTETLNLDRSYRQSDGTFTARFQAEYDRRIDWELCAEFGYQALIGRTLEKTRCVGVTFDQDKIGNVVGQLVQWMDGNDFDSDMLHKPTLQRLIVGFLHRMRVRGAVDNAFLTLYRRVEPRGYALRWLVKGNEQCRSDNKPYFLPHFYQGRMPRLLTTDKTDALKKATQKNPQGLQLDRTDSENNPNGDHNWYYSFFRHCFSKLVEGKALNAIDHPRVNDFYRELVRLLTAAGILDCQEDADERGNVAIRPDALLLQIDTRLYSCSKCGDRRTVAENGPGLGDVPCLVYGCQGHYQADSGQATDQGDNYYAQVYQRSEFPRVYAAEHTGLLSRTEREALEQDFKKTEGRTNHDTNTLSATSTLEMGIDIGALNVVMNAGVPPTPGNFLQRVGRAGRASGSALLLHFAKSDNHDLYYYDAPGEMMRGEVDPPGCFLAAEDILRRHFTAYVLDRWGDCDEGNDIPGSLRTLRNEMRAANNDNAPALFHNRVIAFLNTHLDDLLTSFSSQYAEPEALQALSAEVRKGAIAARLGEVIKRFQSRLQALDDDYAQARQEVATQRAEADKSTANGDRSALYAAKRQLSDVRGRRNALLATLTVEYLTDEGVLPNYAFPETGVRLTASVYSPPPPGAADNEAASDTVDLVRPASQGLKELAPGNWFYTRKLQLPINGIPKGALADVVNARFCQRCDAVRYEGDDTPEAAGGNCCPVCGALGEPVSHPVLLLREVLSRANVMRNAIDASSDQRDSNPSRRQLHFQFKQTAAGRSLALKSQGFGVEYFDDVLLREVNVGYPLSEGGVTIDGQEDVSPLGYRVCKTCGKVTTERDDDEREANDYDEGRRNDIHAPHFAYCPHFGSEEPALFEPVYLYRELHTEALRVLLPVENVDGDGEDVDVAVGLFESGLRLGLRQTYGSRIDHIRFEHYVRKVFIDNDKELCHHYIVLLDTIPGGTGYLKNLLDASALRQIIEHSYDKLRTCHCQEAGKPACYRCVLTYDNQWKREGVTRYDAEVLFSHLRSSTAQWEECPDGLEPVVRSGVIEESELERRFVGLLHSYATERGWSWQNVTEPAAAGHDGSEDPAYHYELSLPDRDGTPTTLWIVPQVDADKWKRMQPRHGGLGWYEGAAANTRVDFLIWRLEEDRGLRPLAAIYTDGYKYHASPEHYRFPTDMALRRDVVGTRCGELGFVWTLTWHDLSLFRASIERHKMERVGQTVDESKIVNNDRDDTLQTLAKAAPHNSMLRLIELLRLPDNEARRQQCEAWRQGKKRMPWSKYGSLPEIEKNVWQRFWQSANLGQWYG